LSAVALAKEEAFLTFVAFLPSKALAAEGAKKVAKTGGRGNGGWVDALQEPTGFSLNFRMLRPLLGALTVNWNEFEPFFKSMSTGLVSPQYPLVHMHRPARARPSTPNIVSLDSS
jgi:hypothetical protein